VSQVLDTDKRGGRLSLHSAAMPEPSWGKAWLPAPLGQARCAS
jgi:hypothetical protein